MMVTITSWAPEVHRVGRFESHKDSLTRHYAGTKIVASRVWLCERRDAAINTWCWMVCNPEGTVLCGGEIQGKQTACNKTDETLRDAGFTFTYEAGAVRDLRTKLVDEPETGITATELTDLRARWRKT